MTLLDKICESQRLGRPIMSHVYLKNNQTGREAKIIVVRETTGYQAIVGYDNGCSMHMWNTDKRRLLSAVRREVVLKLEE